MQSYNGYTLMGLKPVTIKVIDNECDVLTVMRWIKSGTLKTNQLPLRRRHVVTHEEFERFKQSLGFK